MKFREVPSPVPDMRVWSCASGGFSFVISHEQRVDVGAEWTGYTASWKSLSASMRAFGSQPANRIDGGPWKTFGEAERACSETLKQLVRKQ